MVSLLTFPEHHFTCLLCQIILACQISGFYFDRLKASSLIAPAVFDINQPTKSANKLAYVKPIIIVELKPVAKLNWVNEQLCSFN